MRSYGPAVFYCAKPPYTDTDGGVDLGVSCDSPVMCQSGGEVYLGGRCAALQNPFGHLTHPGKPLVGPCGTTGLYRLRRGEAKLLVSLPPGGDAAYPGLVSLKPGELIMSYYSDVAYVSGQVKPMHYLQYRYKRSECDIYIAEIEVGEHASEVQRQDDV